MGEAVERSRRGEVGKRQRTKAEQQQPPTADASDPYQKAAILSPKSVVT